MAFLMEAANRGSISTGYEIDNSLCMEDANDESMIRNYSGDGDRRTWTYSTWIKKVKFGSSQYDYMYLISAAYTSILFLNNDLLRVALYNGSSTVYADPAQRFRDGSAWYHIVVTLDSTDSTAADRVKIYINGVRVTEFDNSTYANMSQNEEFGLGEAASNYQFGYFFAGGANNRGFSGYVAETHYVNGTALDCTSFGEFDDDSGIWIPKEYTGSHGAKGFYFKFDDASNLGKDSATSGIGDFSEGNITAADQATDTPTNNFCTVRPMWTPHDANCSLLEGATVWKINGPSGSGFNPNTSAISTFQFNSGKWYWETTWTNDGDRSVLGIVSSLSDIEQTVDPDRYIWWDGGHIPWNFSGSGSNDLNPPTYDSINTIGIALDMDNDRIAFSKDGGWLDSSGNTSDSSPGYFYSWSSTTFLSHAKANGNVAAFFGINTNANTVAPTHNINFGGYAATIRTSGGNSDANGYGNFAYSVPSGFYAACTKNLAEYGG